MSNIQQIEEQIDKIQNNNMKLFEIFQTVMELPENQKPETLKVTPTKEYQEHRGLYNVVTVDGEPNLVSENIKEGTSIFGVEGSAKTADFKITNGEKLCANGRVDNPSGIVGVCDWEKFTSADSMFDHCQQMTELNLQNANTKNVTTMYNMFAFCSELTSLDISGLNTSSVTTMERMFYSCKKMSTLDLSNFDTSKVTNMNNMFSVCSMLTEIDVSNFDTSNVTNMGSMFQSIGYDCRDESTSLDISNFNMEKVKTISYFFGSALPLTNLKFGTNLGKGYTQKTENYSSYRLDVSSLNKLTHESLMSIINNLYDLNLSYDVANGGTLYRQSLVLGSTNLAKLTPEEIAIATNKGWNVT